MKNIINIFIIIFILFLHCFYYMFLNVKLFSHDFASFPLLGSPRPQHIFTKQALVAEIKYTSSWPAIPTFARNRGPSSSASSTKFHCCLPCQHGFTSWSTIFPECEALPRFDQKTTGKKTPDCRCDRRSYRRNPSAIMEQSCRCQDCALLVRTLFRMSGQVLIFSRAPVMKVRLRKCSVLPVEPRNWFETVEHCPRRHQWFCSTSWKSISHPKCRSHSHRRNLDPMVFRH